MTLQIRQVLFSDADFAQCFQIRLEVFVREQQVPLEEERDADDASALHFLATRDGAPLGTARVVLKDAGTTAKIGRVAVFRMARQQGIGAALIRHIEQTVPAARYTLDAQSQALAFYQQLGYSAFGEEFLEAGIRHRRMRKEAAFL